MEASAGVIEAPLGLIYRANPLNIPSKCGTWRGSLCSSSFLWTRVGLWAAETSCLANSAAWISAEVSSLGTFVLMSQWGRCSPLLFKNESTTIGPPPRVLVHIPGGVLELWTFCTVVSAFVTNLRPLLGALAPPSQSRLIFLVLTGDFSESRSKISVFTHLSS